MNTIIFMAMLTLMVTIPSRLEHLLFRLLDLYRPLQLPGIEVIYQHLTSSSPHIRNPNLISETATTKDTINCPEKVMKTSHFNQTNQSIPSIL